MYVYICKYVCVLAISKNTFNVYMEYVYIHGTPPIAVAFGTY